MDTGCHFGAYPFYLHEIPFCEVEEIVETREMTSQVLCSGFAYVANAKGIETF
jgi:hypothetical protein